MADKSKKKTGSKRAEAAAPPTGRAKGGVARAAALSPEARREIAAKGAAARWGDRPLRATHKGNFKEEFGIDVDCFVLDDEQKTAVISQRGMGVALGSATTSGTWVQGFVGSDKMAPYVGLELGEKLKNPLKFQWTLGGLERGLQLETHGYDVTILIDICKAIIKADEDGKLLARQANIAKQARIIINASAKAGIKGLVYALSGYDATREEVVAAFKLYIREEAREYEKEFPPELYAEWFRLYELPRPESNKQFRPWKFKNLTIDHVYYPLAKSSGKILRLARSQRASSAQRHKKVHQFLSEIGVKTLRTHLGRLLGMAETSKTRAEYEGHVERVFGRQQSLPFAPYPPKSPT